MALARIEEVLEDLHNGKMVILVDDEDRENEGDLCMAAETEVLNPSTKCQGASLPFSIMLVRMKMI